MELVILTIIVIVMAIMIYIAIKSTNDREKTFKEKFGDLDRESLERLKNSIKDTKTEHKNEKGLMLSWIDDIINHKK